MKLQDGAESDSRMEAINVGKESSHALRCLWSMLRGFHDSWRFCTRTKYVRQVPPSPDVVKMEDVTRMRDLENANPPYFWSVHGE